MFSAAAVEVNSNSKRLNERIDSKPTTVNTGFLSSELHVEEQNIKIGTSAVNCWAKRTALHQGVELRTRGVWRTSFWRLRSTRSVSIGIEKPSCETRDLPLSELLPSTWVPPAMSINVKAWVWNSVSLRYATSWSFYELDCSRQDERYRRGGEICQKFCWMLIKCEKWR